LGYHQKRSDVDVPRTSLWRITSLNFGVTSLILKAQEVNHIHQYLPICLLNINYKIFTKVATNIINQAAEDLPFTIDTEVLGYGTGAILMQNSQPIGFFSQALGPKASSQTTYDKEAMAIIQALKKWRHYFFGGGGVGVMGGWFPIF
jgi:hypothetical protein